MRRRFAAPSSSPIDNSCRAKYEELKKLLPADLQKAGVRSAQIIAEITKAQSQAQIVSDIRFFKGA